MPKSPEQKARSRQAIMQSAAKLFRERGFDGVTVAEVMDGAGLTHGGFPRHFASKDELITATLAEVFDANDRSPVLPATDLATFARAYLQTDHRMAPGTGCVFAALGPEMARAGEPTREVLSAQMERQIEKFADLIPEGDVHQRRVQAIGAWATMVGAMMLARIANTDALSEEILGAARSYLKVEA